MYRKLKLEHNGDAVRQVSRGNGYFQLVELRRGDAVKLGKQHVRDGIATIRTEKSQGEIIVSIPILPVLAETMAAGPCGDLTFIVRENGQPLTKESFGNMFRAAAAIAVTD